MAETTEDKWPTEKWVCTGKVTLAGKGSKDGMGFQKVEDDGSLGKPVYFEAKKLKGIHVGSLYEVEVQGNSVRLGTMKWLDNWHDSEQRMIWQTRSRAFDTAKRVKAREKAATRFPAALDALAGLREEYWKADHVGRLSIEVQVLAYLRGYKTKSTDKGWVE